MITRIQGKLVEVTERAALVQVDSLTYSILIPAADYTTLLSRIDEQIDFHTLYYFEGQSQGNSFIPRLIGFSNEKDRSFFQLFTTVKGIGNRKALRALVRPFNEIACAIAQRDIAVLTELPEIGKRSAETIVAQLHGKIDDHIGAANITIEPSEPAIFNDAIEMIIRIMKSKKTLYRTYNLGDSRQEIKIYDLAKKIIKIVNKNKKIKSKKINNFSPKRRSPRMTKLLKEIDFKLNSSLNSNLIKTVKWYKKKL